jgi:hypothetical protein
MKIFMTADADHFPATMGPSKISAGPPLNGVIASSFIMIVAF